MLAYSIWLHGNKLYQLYCPVISSELHRVKNITTTNVFTTITNLLYMNTLHNIGNSTTTQNEVSYGWRLLNWHEGKQQKQIVKKKKEGNIARKTLMTLGMLIFVISGVQSCTTAALSRTLTLPTPFTFGESHCFTHCIWLSLLWSSPLWS